MNRCETLAKALTVVLALLPVAASAVSVQLQASEDTTLFSQENGLGNGAGPNLFVGNTARNSGLRRSLLRFDLLAAALPDNARITDASLRMVMDQSSSFSSQPISLHRLNTSWGEGTAVSLGGQGAFAGPTDATWTRRFYENDTGPAWSALGGDFEATASATTPVGVTGTYLWTSGAMAIEVQTWLDDPSSNHGWIMIGNEVDLGTARRFVSSEGGNLANRPMLTIDYQLAPIPEPEVVALLSVGLTMIGIARVRVRCCQR